MQKTNAFSRFRKNSELTLDGAAEKLGVDRKTILRWEQGTTPIPAERVIELERMTGISRHELRPDLSRIFVQSPTSDMAQAS